MKQKAEVIINQEQGLYVIPCGKGFSCLGFDVVNNKIQALSKELNLKYRGMILERGTMEVYNIYLEVVEAARKKHEETGWRSKAELYEPFIGQEGKRVEVVYKSGEKERFYIGKSTGFIPCHIMLKKSNSMGGMAVLKNSIQSIHYIMGKNGLIKNSIRNSTHLHLQESP